MGTITQRSIAWLLALFLLINTVNVDGKRLFGGSSRKSSGSSNSRHTTSTGSRTHYSPSVSHNTHTSNHDLTRLSYANTHTAPVNRGSSFGSNTHHQPSVPHATPAPIGWNVPKNQGPPPAYNPVNPVGGAKTNLHESPPAYRPSTGTVHNPSAPPYPGATNSNSKPFTPAQTYRPRYNSTGGFGSGTNVHTPISASNAGHGVQSSYPRQQVPAGATYYPSSSSLPAGAAYHPTGGIPPHGTNYYQSNSHMPAGNIPHGATYYPSSSHLPPGATYHPAGHIPQGAQYYPSAGIPAAAHYPSAPAGATYLPAGASLPAGAVYYSQPPKSSSGLGFGSGLAAGALGGALLGHALTPSRTTSYAQPGYNSAPAQSHDDKVIIINNGPPGSVTTTNAGDGVTVINAGQQQTQPAQSYQPAQPAPSYQPAQPAYQPVQPVQPAQPAQPAVQPGAPLAPVQQQPNPVDSAATASQPANTAVPTDQAPPPGGIICVPVKTQQPDPKDATKMIEVEQIACYPAPPPEASTVAPTVDNATNATTTTSPLMPAASTTENGVVLAPIQTSSAPFVVPEGSVPLAPLNPNAAQPDIMHMPGEPTLQHHSASQAQLAPGSNLHVATNTASKYFDSFAFTSVFSLLLAYCLH